MDLNKDGNIDVHELDHAVHKHHMQMIHELDMLMDPLERFAYKVKQGRKQLPPDAHSRYRERPGKQFLDPQSAGHMMRKKLLHGPKAVGMVIHKPRHDVSKTIGQTGSSGGMMCILGRTDNSNSAKIKMTLKEQYRQLKQPTPRPKTRQCLI